MSIATIIGDLDRQGLRPGAVLMAIGGNSEKIWTLLQATEKLGLVLAIVNDTWSETHIATLRDKLNPHAVIGYGRRRLLHSTLEDFVEGWLEQNDKISWRGKGLKDQKVHIPEGFTAIEGAVVFSTSGSTGEPKCVVSSFRNRVFSTATIAAYLGLRKGQSILNALSPSFDYGFYQGLLAAQCGLDLELIPSVQMTGELLARIRKTPHAVLPLTPALAARLCCAARANESFGNVEIVTLTGGAVSIALRRKLAATFPDANIFAMYGLTECKRVAYLEPSAFLDRPYSCGREMAGVTARVVDVSGRELGAGEAGELTVEGENVCLGYWRDPEATSQRFRKQDSGKTILFTGDRFRRDRDGYLEFLGRTDGLVKLRDERVSLAQIETELRASELVLDLALRLETDDLGIPVLTAAVVGDAQSVTESDILRSFRQCVSRPGHLPHRIQICSGIDINEHGKRALQAVHCEAPA